MGFLIRRLRKPSTSTFRDARVGPQFYAGLKTASYWGRDTSRTELSGQVERSCPPESQRSSAGPAPEMAWRIAAGSIDISDSSNKAEAVGRGL